MELPLEPFALLYLAIVVVIAAYVRGFAGFGFALVSVPRLAELKGKS